MHEAGEEASRSGACWRYDSSSIPLNLAIGPFAYGGDALGIAAGLQVPVLLVQAVALVVFLVDREVVAQRLLPAYSIETKHPLCSDPGCDGRSRRRQPSHRGRYSYRHLHRAATHEPVAPAPASP